MPWTLLGPVDYQSHEGSKPMAIIWKVRTPIPADIELCSSISGVG